MENDDSDCGQVSSTADSKKKKKENFEVKVVLLNHIPDLKNVTLSILIRSAYRVKICEKGCTLLEKTASFEDV